eukprot:6203110-Pleurochrysis_carterae.AAC.3
MRSLNAPSERTDCSRMHMLSGTQNETLRPKRVGGLRFASRCNSLMHSLALACASWPAQLRAGSRATCGAPSSYARFFS